MHARLHVETGGGHLLAEVGGVLGQRAAKVVSGSQHFERLDAGATCGGSELENRYGRERWRSSSITSALAQVKPPSAPPMACPECR